MIDNYEHGYAHIHPERKEIRTQKLEETLNIIYQHINKHNGVDLKELRQELIK